MFKKCVWLRALFFIVLVVGGNQERVQAADKTAGGGASGKVLCTSKCKKRNAKGHVCLKALEVIGAGEPLATIMTVGDGDAARRFFRASNCTAEYLDSTVLPAMSVTPVAAVWMRNCDLLGDSRRWRSFVVYFQNVRELHLNKCGLSDLKPEGILYLLPNLEVCDLSDNSLVDLPAGLIEGCSKLKTLDLSRNPLLMDLSGLKKPEASSALTYLSCAGCANLTKPPVFWCDVYNFAKCTALGEEMISAYIVWAPGSSEKTAKLKEHVSKSNTRCAVGADATVKNEWFVGSNAKMWRELFTGLLKRYIKQVLTKNSDLFCPVESADAAAGWISGDSLEDALAKVELEKGFSREAVEGFFAQSAEYRKYHKGTAAKTQVALRSVPVKEYAQNTRALAALAASTVRKVRALACFCAYAATQLKYEVPVGDGYTDMLFKSFSAAHVVSPTTDDIARLSEIFPSNEVNCPTNEYKEYACGMDPKVYDHWDQLYVIHRSLDAVFRALLYRLLNDGTGPWSETIFSDAEKKCVTADYLPVLDYSVFDAIEMVAEPLEQLSIVLGGVGGLGPVPGGVVADLTEDKVTVDFKPLVKDLQYCVTTARKLQGL